jgi:hypothetical protein
MRCWVLCPTPRLTRFEKNSMKQLDDYFRLQDEIFAHFGYPVYWPRYPIRGNRKQFWRISDHFIQYANTMEQLAEGKFHQDELLFIQQGGDVQVAYFPGEQYTMIAVCGKEDGHNVFAVFDNKREVTD